MKGPPRGEWEQRPRFSWRLVALLLARLTAARASNGFLYAFLFAWLQVEGVSLNLLDNVILLDFAREAPKGILQRFALLQPDLSQTGSTT